MLHIIMLYIYIKYITLQVRIQLCIIYFTTSFQCKLQIHKSKQIRRSGISPDTSECYKGKTKKECIEIVCDPIAKYFRLDDNGAGSDRIPKRYWSARERERERSYANRVAIEFDSVGWP